MKLSDHLNKDTKVKLSQIHKPNKKAKKRNHTPKKKEERIDWSDLMGMNRQTLKRGKGGVMKKK